MTLVASSERDEELEVQDAELMASRMISGLLIVTSVHNGSERLHALQSPDFPIVGFDRPIPGLETDAVLVENRSGAEGAVRHLVEHGHKRIACVGYDSNVYTIHERLQGYFDQMRTAGLEADGAGYGQHRRRAAVGRIDDGKTGSSDGDLFAQSSDDLVVSVARRCRRRK